jgi:8-oxo-dGTP pyrophosphatase MutT (NUDIX family)
VTRQDLIKQLSQYSSFNETEESFRQQMLKLVQEEEDCFNRSLLHGHLTGSAFIIDPESKQVLLLHHRKLDKWLQPGGHADGDENIARVAMREALEETGLKSIRLLQPAIFDLDIHPIPERKGVPAHLHYDVRYLFIAEPSEPFQLNHESKALAWVAIEQVAEKCDYNTSICRMLDKLRYKLTHTKAGQAV